MEVRHRVLAVDDDHAVLTGLRRVLSVRGFELTTFDHARPALAELEARPGHFEVVLSDMSMPDIDGLQLLERVRVIEPRLPVVMLTADNTAETAVQALTAGAFNYLTKPPRDPDAVAAVLRRAVAHGGLARRAHALERKLALSERFEQLVGSSEPMRNVFSVIDQVADLDVSVLVLGESGTGKELAARAIHERSSRSSGPFVALNCAAMPEGLVDSELFGHVRGAFTGAVESRAGAFERAHGGTLFLDEIGDVPPVVQVRLLRALQEREVTRVGDGTPRRVDVRVVAATLRDLEQVVDRGEFRADLYYRLNVVSVRLPPLRDRGDDVVLLAAHFLSKHAHRMGRDVPRFAPDAIDALMASDWPGNVRELENAVQRALALSPGPEIPRSRLPERVLHAADRAAPSRAARASRGPSGELSWAEDLPFKEARKRAQRDFERAYLDVLLDRTRGNISEAARRAGMDRSNFKRALARVGLDPASYQ